MGMNEKRILHKKEGLNSFWQAFLRSITPTSCPCLRTNKLMPFSIKAEEIDAPMIFWIKLLDRKDLLNFFFSLDLSILS